MNRSASASRAPPAGSTATAGCCPMLAHHPNFYSERFAASFPPPPPLPTATHRNFLGQLQQQQQLPQPPNSAQLLPPPPTTQAPVTNHHVVQAQHQPTTGTTLVGPNLNNTANNQLQPPPQAPQQQQIGLPTALTNNQRDHYNTSTADPAHTLPLQHLFARSLPPPNCMGLVAAAIASSFHQQQLQLQQAAHQQQQQQQQQQIQSTTPINQPQQQTTNSTNVPSGTAPQQQTTTQNNTNSNPNQVPLLNFNSYTGVPPFMMPPAPSAPVAAHLNFTNNSQPPTQQAQHQPQESIPLQAQPQQQAPQQQQTQPQQNQQQNNQPPIPQLPNFYSTSQMEQALALLTNYPQITSNLYLFTALYLQGGLRTDPHHTHHHPPHYHHHLHGSHHNHHHHHGPNGQHNGPDDTMLTMSESKPRGLTKHEIDSLTPYIQMNEKDSRSCVICLSKFELKSKIRPLPCNHAFHAKCVDKWLRANRTCPICRRDASKTSRSKLKRI